MFLFGHVPYIYTFFCSWSTPVHCWCFFFLLFNRENTVFYLFIYLFFYFQDESLKWTDHGNFLLQNNDFRLAEECANFALYFHTSPSTRAQACLCKAFAQYEMGKTTGARRDINDVKRLDANLARVRKILIFFLRKKWQVISFQFMSIIKTQHLSVLAKLTWLKKWALPFLHVCQFCLTEKPVSSPAFD